MGQKHGRFEHVYASGDKYIGDFVSKCTRANTHCKHSTQTPRLLVRERKRGLLTCVLHCVGQRGFGRARECTSQRMAIDTRDSGG